MVYSNGDVLRFFRFKSKKKQGSLASKLTADAIDALDQIDEMDLTPQESTDGETASEFDLASFILQAQTGEELPPPAEPETAGTTQATVTTDAAQNDAQNDEPTALGEDARNPEPEHSFDAVQDRTDADTEVENTSEDEDVILFIDDTLVIDDTLAPLEAAADFTTPSATAPALASDLMTPPKKSGLKRMAGTLFLLSLILVAGLGFYIFVEKGLTPPPNTTGLEDGLQVVSVTHETLDSRLGETLLINIDLYNNSSDPQKMGKIDIYLMGQNDQVLTNWQIDTSGRAIPEQNRTLVTTRLFTIPPGMTDVIAVHKAAQ